MIGVPGIRTESPKAALHEGQEPADCVEKVDSLNWLED